MSRWDALRSEESTKAPSRSNRSSERGRSDYQRPKDPVGGSLSKNPPSTSRSCNEVVAALQRAITDEETERSIVELSHLSQQELQELPAEKAASDVVDSILLKALGVAEPSSKLERGIIEALTRIMQLPSLCSALVSPLTINVDEETGLEERLSNPIGERLLIALQERLPQSCNALTIMIQQMQKRSIIDTLPLDIRKIKIYLDGYIASPHSLSLLRVVLTTYDDSYQTLKSLLFSDFRHKSGLTPSLGCHYGTIRAPLLDLLDDRQYESSACISLFLNACPLRYWLNPKAAGSMKLFGLNVKQDLIELMRIMVCRFSVQEDFCKLLATALTVIPFIEDQGDELTMEGMKLVSCMANCAMKDPDAAALLDCFCECVGGRAQPSGGNSTTSKPLALWLNSVSSSTFQDYLFLNGHEPTSSSSFSSSTKLLCAIIRIQPDFIGWHRFRNIVANNISKVPSRVDGMLLLEHFAVGRSDVSARVEESSLIDQDISRFLFRTFHEAASDQSSKVRLSCLRGYAALIWHDWLYALQSQNMQAALSQLKRFCEHGTTTEKPLAFKAMGEMLSKCWDSPRERDFSIDGGLSNLWSIVLPVLKKGLHKTTEAAARSMAAFAVGNLALGIRERNSQNCVLSVADLADLMDLTCSCIDASNDKVAGNSIRAIGHLGFLAFRNQFVFGSTTLDNAVEHHGTIVKLLTRKVRNAIDWTPSARLTWKERSSAKKHGWGACHSLGHVLDCELTLSNLEEAREACATLICCIQKYSSLSEKIVLAAIAALHGLQLDHLECLSKRTGIVGFAVSCCLQAIVIGTTTPVNQRLKAHLVGFLQRVVPILSVLDARKILQSESIAARHLEWLCDWMVANKMKSEPYEMIAIAFEQEDPWNSNMSIQQRFASRAAWSYRGQGSQVDDAENDDEL